jgi:hypothetical protein
MIKKSLIIFVIALSTNILSFGQSAINSPYTRFGVGEIDRNGFNNSKAMGGISTGLRERNQINYMNPAAISAQDTMSFIFDVGVKGIYNNLKTTNNNLTYKNVSFDHIAIAFPIKRWWFASVGVTPYSKIGYNIEQYSPHPYFDTVNVYQDNVGDGGINQLYISNSFKLGKHLAIGFNFNYLFGTIERYNQTYIDIPESYSTINYDKYTFNKSTFDFGIQYYTDLLDKYFFVLGATYSNKINFAAERETVEFNATNFRLSDVSVVDYVEMSSQFDTLSSSTDGNYEIDVPARFSLGFTTGIKDKLKVGFDYSIQDWTDVESLNSIDSYTLDETFNCGIEYIPNKFSLRNYFKHVHYKAGFYYNKSYMKIDNNQINNYGITFGLGLPIVNQKTRLNVSYTYGKRGTTDNGLIQEDYSVIGLNLTLYDFWFFKRKFQ